MGRSDARPRNPSNQGHGYHLPVMADEIAELMVVDPDGRYLDATLGGGGHAGRILEKLSPKGGLIGLDRDMEAVERNKLAFENEPRMRVERAEFSRLAEFCPPGSLSGALFDLGVSSRQLDAKERGFSFVPGTALDMRMGSEGPAASDLISGWDEWELASILRRNSDIDEAKRLARTILEAVEAGEEMTSDLIRKAVDKLPGMRDENRNSMLARVFQAIRMEVNDEMGQVQTGMRAAVAALKTGGRLCVLSYHSVEDRKVKETLAEFEKDCICAPNLPVCMCGGNNRSIRKVLRKPGLPSDAERERNPRARSAKLRVVEKI
ncbi:MAG: mraW [Fibrobacteres bacterium]|nr:mraW [Fibrobacterota bacterium]